MPKTTLGRWSVGLIVAMPVLFFIGRLLLNLLYKSVPAGNTILEDIAERPALALTMLSGMVSGISGCLSITTITTRSVALKVLILSSMTCGREYR